MLAKSQTIYSFADEMEKIAKATSSSSHDDEPNLNTFERHPKKILGGAAAALAGGALLARKLKKGPSGPGIHIPKGVGEAFSDSSREKAKRKVIDFIKGNRSRTKKLGPASPPKPTSAKPSYRVSVGKLSEDDMESTINDAFNGHGMPHYNIKKSTNTYHSDMPSRGPYGTKKK
jgi:hypothetical protein